MQIIRTFEISHGFQHELEDFLTKVWRLGHASTVFDVPIDYELDPEVQKWISNRAFESRQLQDIYVQSELTDYLHSYVQEGKPYSDFKDSIGELLSKMGVTTGDGLKPYHVETIFRTEAATASNYGRWTIQQENVDVTALMEFVYVHDQRHVEGTICYEIAKKGGLFMPPDWEGWKKIYPPNHFGCRSRVIAHTKEAAQSYGLKRSSDSVLDDIPAPADGFEGTAWEWK